MEDVFPLLSPLFPSLPLQPLIYQGLEARGIEPLFGQRVNTDVHPCLQGL
jgi:hypothetical protein